MTYGGQYPGTGGFSSTGTGRHRSVGADEVDLTKTTAYTAGQYAQPRPEPYYAPEPDYPADPVEFDDPVEPLGDGRPPRSPWVLATIVGITVFLATITIGGTLLAVNDSRARRAENYGEGPPTSTVTMTESITTTETTTVTSTPSRSPRSSAAPYGEDDDSSSAETASSGWYAQYGSFTSLDSARDLASRVGAEVYNGEEFGQPGQFVVAQREYSRSSARDACDIAEQSCIVKQVD